MKNGFIAFVLLFAAFPLKAQTPEAPKELRGSLAFGMYAHTYGVGIMVEAMKLREKNDLLLTFSFGSCRNLNERKIESVYADQNGKAYVWDKKNYFFVLGGTIGLSRDLIPLGPGNRMSLKGSASMGPLLGFLKPYYVEVAVPISQTSAEIRPYAYDATRFTYNDIFGEADFFYGMSDMALIPGGRLSGGLTLDFSPSRDYIRAIEFLAFADIFAKRPRILDQGKNQLIFLGGSVAFLLGDRF